MLPRMQAATAAPWPVAGAWPWPATGVTWTGPAADWPIDEPDVRAAALGALARLGELTTADVLAAFADDGPRRAPARRRRRPGRAGQGLALHSARRPSPRPWPIPIRSWPSAPPGSSASGATASPSPRLVALATGATDTRCREAAVAALGAIGDPSGFDAVLAALDDRPTVRRRATVALAGFDDPRVEPALRQAASDRDWQVRQAADELLDEPLPEPDDPGGRRPRRPGRRCSVVLGEQPLQPVEGLQADARPLHHALERRVDEVHRHRRRVRPAAGSCRGAARRPR